MSIHDDNQYEDLLGLWSDLESGLGVILGSPGSIQEFEKRVWQYDRWMKDLLKRDADVGLYLLFQLASNSPVGYSASHSLVSAVLSHLIAQELHLPYQERDSLVHAALTMNIAMTALQDELATQPERPSAGQLDAIRLHAMKGALMLANLGVVDELWLETITSHHDELTDAGDLYQIQPGQRLARILRVVDRYAAMISPRQSRAGRSATDSARKAIESSTSRKDEVGHALVRAVGLCPPGTYVLLDNRETAVVMRRSATPNRPHVAIVLDAQGGLLSPPRLHRTAHGRPDIKSALAASAMHEHLNHFQILQLGAYAAQHP